METILVAILKVFNPGRSGKNNTAITSNTRHHISQITHSTSHFKNIYFLETLHIRHYTVFNVHKAILRYSRVATINFSFIVSSGITFLKKLVGSIKTCIQLLHTLSNFLQPFHCKTRRGSPVDRRSFPMQLRQQEKFTHLAKLP